MNLFFDVFEEHLKNGNFIRMDETTVQDLHEKGRSPQTKSYMWGTSLLTEKTGSFQIFRVLSRTRI